MTASPHKDTSQKSHRPFPLGFHQPHVSFMVTSKCKGDSEMSLSGVHLHS